MGDYWLCDDFDLVRRASALRHQFISCVLKVVCGLWKNTEPQDKAEMARLLSIVQNQGESNWDPTYSLCEKCDKSKGTIPDEREHGVLINESHRVCDFYSHLLRKINSAFSDSNTYVFTRLEIEDIKSSVEEIVHSIVSSLPSSSIQHEDKGSKHAVVEMGSFYDKTKIGQPDEFDFLAVVQRLQNGCYVPERSCTERPGSCHLVVKDKTGQHKILTSVTDENGQVNVKSFRWKCLKDMHFSIQTLGHQGTVNKETGVLTVENYAVAINGPQCILKLRWKPTRHKRTLSISVDLVPAIEIERVSDVINRCDVVDESVYTELVNARRCYVIAKPLKSCDYCFKLVFPNADQSLVQNLDVGLKNALHILKYVANLVNETSPLLKKVFNTFSLKMAVLQYNFNDEVLRSKRVHVGTSVVGILSIIHNGLEQTPPFLSSAFTIGRNVWGTLSHSPEAEKDIVSQSKQLVWKLKTFFSDTRLTEEMDEIEFHELRCDLVNICHLYN